MRGVARFRPVGAEDGQPLTSDVFVFQDLIDAGRMPGPRAWSTGPGVFRNSPEATDADIAAVLARYRNHHRTPNIKVYMVGDRPDHRRMARVLAEQGMMATTEGASDLDLDLTHFIDGFAGGATPMEALHAATLGSAQVIGRSGEVGSLEPGKFADILILDADPRDHISNSRDLYAS